MHFVIFRQLTVHLDFFRHSCLWIDWLGFYLDSDISIAKQVAQYMLHDVATGFRKAAKSRRLFNFFCNLQLCVVSGQRDVASTILSATCNTVTLNCKFLKELPRVTGRLGMIKTKKHWKFLFEEETECDFVTLRLHSANDFSSFGKQFL